MVDLHVHSNQSDGSLAPQELIDLACVQGVSTLALCDHDTTAGIAVFIDYARHKHIHAIPGIELSATWDKGGNCHLLGLGVDPANSALQKALLKNRQSRAERNIHIVERLNALGMPITMEEISTRAGGEVVARPHIAQVMVDKGFVSTIQDAFDRFLAKGAPAYVDRFRLMPAEAVRLLCDAGALPVLAHPSQLRLSFKDLEMFIQTLKPYGLAGMEVFTPYATAETIKAFHAMAEKFSLICTGGSDFHGTNKPENRLGYYCAALPVPDECAEQVVHHLTLSTTPGVLC